MARTFIFREEWLTYMEPLTRKQRTNVIDAIIGYAFQSSEGDVCQLQPIEQAVFNCIKGSIDRDRDKYEQTAAKNRENGKRGGRPKGTKNPVGFLGFSQKPSDNRWVSGENPEKNVGFDENPILNLIPNSQSYILNPNPSSYSSSEEGAYALTSEEEQEQKILSYFFFKNWQTPNEEYRQFVAYNCTGGRSWSTMSEEERTGAAILWTQKPPQKPRFSETFLSMWQQIYTTARKLGAPVNTLRECLSDDIAWEKDESKLVICCADELREYLERHLDDFKPILWSFIKSQECKSIYFSICPR